MGKSKSLFRLILSIFLIFSICITNLGSQVDAASAGWKHNSKGWWYSYQDGSYPANKWASIGGKWYHFNAQGYMETGWIKSGGKWYFLNSNGSMATGWVKSGGKWYYMNSSGAMATGWIKSGGKWYYMNSSGAMVTGWVTVGGKKYYMNSSGAMVTGKQIIDGKEYLFNSSGALVEEAKEYALNKTEITLKAGDSFNLELNGADAAGVEWKSSNGVIASADKGCIFANQPGSCSITATYNQKNYSCKVNVVDFEFSYYNMHLEPGEDFSLGVTLKGPTVSYTWSSTDETVATVNDNGLIHATPGQGGECDIRVGFETANGMSYKAVHIFVDSFSTLYKTDFTEGNNYNIATEPKKRELTDGMGLDLTLLSSGIEKVSDKYYEHPGDMDTVRLGDFDYFFLSDTWANRVIIFRVPCNVTFNGADASDYIYAVLGQKDTVSSKAGYDLSSLNWPVGVAAVVTPEEKIRVFVADAKNDRILVWNDLPQKGNNGAPADFSIMQMIDSTDYSYGEDAAFINTNESRIAWPWDLWTDGNRLICTSTQNGYVLLWEDNLPTAEDKYPDRIIKTGGTPRTITCKDDTLLLGDHNIRKADGSELPALRVFNDYKKVSYEENMSKTNGEKVLFLYAEDPGDFVYSDGNSGQPSGLYLTADMATRNGDVLPKGTLLLHEAGAITVRKDGKIDSENDIPDYYIGGSQIDCDDYYYFVGGDICSLVQDEKGNLFSLGINAGKIVGFTNGTFPDEPDAVSQDVISQMDGDTFVYNGAYYWNNREEGIVEKHCIEDPNICIGAADCDEKVADTLYKYQNCKTVSDGKHLLVVDDYNSTVCLWKNIPDENDAKPDMRLFFAKSVEDAAYVEDGQLTGLIISERGRLYYWKDINELFNGGWPEVYFNGKVGSISFNYIKSIDYCDGYLYIVQDDTLYIYEGIPSKDSEPKAAVKLSFKAQSGREINYYSPDIHVTKCDDGNTYISMAASTDSATIISLSDALNGYAGENAWVIEGCHIKTVAELQDGIRRYEDTYRSFNGVADIIVTKDKKVIVADGGFGRVVVWNTIEDAVSELYDEEVKSILILGHGKAMYDSYDVMFADPTNDIFNMAYDVKAIQSEDTFYNAHYIEYDGTYLWVGDYKFSGGVKRFTLDLS